MSSDSYVIRTISVITAYLGKILYTSSVYRVLKKFVDWLRICFGPSRFMALVKREDKLSKLMPKSKIYWLLSKILHWPTKIMRTKYENRKHIFEDSKVFSLIALAADNLHVLASIALFIILIIPHSFWYNIFATLMVFGLLVLLFIKTVIHKDIFFNFKYINFYLAIFILSIVLAQIFSIFPSMGVRFLVFYITCLLFVFILVNSINNKDQLLTVIETILMGVSAVGLYAIFQGIRGVPVNASQTDVFVNAGMPGRVYSTMENPNNLAEILMMILPFYLAIFLGSKSVIKRFIIAGMGILPLIALGLTYSRSSWIGFAVAMLMFVILTNWRYVPLFLLAGIALIPILPQSIYRRIMTIFGSSDSSMNYRVLIYRTIAPMFEEYWFTGIGLGTDTFMSIVRNYPLHTGVVPPHTHNLFIQIWIEVGLIGILSFIGFIISTVKKGIESIRSIVNDKDNYIKFSIIAGISSLVGILVVGLAEYIWYYPRVMIVFWVVVGLLLAAIKQTHISANN